MPIWKSVLLGIIQGVAEFLPISSSGHLVIIKEILGIDLESGGVFFDVMLHLGTLFAIFVAFRRDIGKIIVEGLHIIADLFANIITFIQNIFKSNKPYRRIVSSAYRKYLLLLIVSTIPTAIIGLLLSDIVEVANGMVIIPGMCFLITALFLLIADFTTPGSKRPKEVSYLNAGIVGTAQGLATMPGISRSGTTITACLLCGFDRRFAVKYSFIMSIPAVIGAVIFELKDFDSVIIRNSDIPGCITATIVAALVGYLSICFMMSLVRGKKYKYFAIYCAVIGIATIVYAAI